MQSVLYHSNASLVKCWGFFIWHLNRLAKAFITAIYLLLVKIKSKARLDRCRDLSIKLEELELLKNGGDKVIYKFLTALMTVKPPEVSLLSLTSSNSLQLSLKPP